MFKNTPSSLGTHVRLVHGDLPEGLQGFSTKKDAETYITEQGGTPIRRPRKVCVCCVCVCVVCVWGGEGEPWRPAAPARNFPRSLAAQHPHAAPHPATHTHTHTRRTHPKIYFTTREHAPLYAAAMARSPSVFKCQKYHKSRRTFGGHEFCYTGPRTT